MMNNKQTSKHFIDASNRALEIGPALLATGLGSLLMEVTISLLHLELT